MSDIATLTLRIDSLEAKQAKADLDKLEAAGKSVSKVAAMMEGSFKSLMIALGPVALGGAFIAAVKGAIELQERYVRLSEVAGTTAAMISSMDLPARLAGTSLDQVAMSVARLSKSIGEAALGDVQKQGMFKALGIDPKDGRDAALVMMDLAKSLVDMKDQNVAAAASISLLGRGFAEIRPFMKELTEQGTLQATVTNEQAKRAKEFEDSLTRLAFRSQLFRMELAEGLLPALEQLVKVFTELTGKSNDAKAFSEVVGEGLLFIARAGVGAATTFELLGDTMAAVAAVHVEVVKGNFKEAYAILKAMGDESDRILNKAANTMQKLSSGYKSPESSGRMSASQGDIRKAEPGYAEEAERRVRELMEFNKHYEARIAAAKGFYELYASAVKTGNILVGEALKQGEISEKTALEQVGANEDARLKTLRNSLEEQAKLHHRKGELGKESETAAALAQVNAEIIANEVITQAKITSLRAQSDLEYQRGIELKMADLQISQLDQLQLLDQQYVERQNLIDQWRGEEEGRDEQWQALSARNFYEYEKSKTAISDEEAKKRYNINKIYRDLDMDSAGAFFGYMSLLMKTKSREMFEVGKVAALAEIGINTYKAAMGAYTSMVSIPYVGPFLAVAAAAAAIAYGVQQAQQVSSMSYGGSGPSGGGAAPTFSASPVTGLPTGSQPAQAAEQAPATIIHIEGEFFTAQQIRDLFEKFNDTRRDGGRVVTA